MIRATDIHSLTEFTRNAKTYIQKIKETKNPVAITINGEAEVVIQDAQSYQLMIDELEQARFVQAVKLSIADADAGLGRPAEDLVAEMRAKYGL